MATHAPDSSISWRIAILLFFFSVINFMDKLVMGLAGVPIMTEFGLSPTEYGALGSSFYALYAISGLLTGLFIVDRISPKILLAVLVTIWSVSQLPIVFGGSLLALYAGRIMLGIGEGPGTPSAYHALYGWFSSDKRNLPTSLLIAGIGTGFLVGSPLLTAILAEHGWRAGFAFCGIIGAAWVVLWMILGADGPLIERHESGARDAHHVPWRQFWTDRTVVANAVVATACYWLTGLSITWLAPYLQLGLGYTPYETGWLVSVILGSQIVVQVFLSWLSHHLLNSGHSSRLSRGVINGTAVAAAGAILVLATLVEQPHLKVLLLALAFTMPQISFVIGPAIIGEITPPRQRGTALLITYSVITVAGFFSPIVTGWVVQAAGIAKLDGYTHALWMTGAILVFGGIWALIDLNPEAARARLGKTLAAPQAVPATAIP